MTKRLILFLLLTIMFVTCLTYPGFDDEDYIPEYRGFSDYETWKPEAPEVILIKHKDTHTDSIGSFLKQNLPLLAVLAPLLTMSVLLPRKSYHPPYILFPTIAPTTPATVQSMRGYVENGTFEKQGLTAQLLHMIEEIGEVYKEIVGEKED